MIKITVWFNHWFSTIYHIINMIKETENFDIKVIGSNANDYVVYKKACDEWYVEPDGLSKEDYVNYCLSFCKEHFVDVFIPKRNQDAIAEAKDRFDEIGVKLFIDCNYEILKILDNKAKTYEYFENIIPEAIPEYYVIKSVEDFKNKYVLLSNKYKKICYKLLVDEGARSFRVISNDIEGPRGLLEKPGYKVTLNAAINVLSTYDFSNPILMMPFLDGVEVSADCLKTKKGNIVLPRYKTNKRYSEIIFNKELMEYCNKIIDELNFEMPLNIQFKKDNETGLFFLLEINPRMSGGLQLSRAGSDINIPSVALGKLYNVDIDWEYPDYDYSKVVHIETPISF